MLQCSCLSIFSLYHPYLDLELTIFISPPYRISLSRSESSYSTGAPGFSAWRNLERKTKQLWAPVPLQATSTPPTLLLTTPAPTASRWAPYRGRRPRSPPRPTGAWTCTSATTRWARTTLLSHLAPIQVWWCAAAAVVEATPTAPPNMKFSQNTRGLCCWSRFRRFLGSWRRCSTSPGASGIRTRERRSAASGSLQRRWWIGYAWWPSRSSPSSAPSPSSCQPPTSSRLFPKTSHKADIFPLWKVTERQS